MLRDKVSEIAHMSGCVHADSWKSFPMFYVSSSSVQLELGLCECVTLVRAANTLKQCIYFAQISMPHSYMCF
jgi:hypothetical protein